MLPKIAFTGPIRRHLSKSALASKKQFYKNMITEEDNTKPSNWESSLPFDKLPGPKPIPLLGNLHRFLPRGEYFGKSVLEQHRMNYNKYGPIFKLTGIPGLPEIIFIFNPEDIENLHRNEGVWPIRRGSASFSYYRNITRKNIFKGVAGVSNSHGEAWYNLRTVLNPILMQPRVVQQYINGINEVSDQFVENIRHFSSLNEMGEMPADFQNEIYKWSLELVGLIALDRHFGCLNRNLDKNSEPQKLIDSATGMFKLMAKLDLGPSLWLKINTPNWLKFVETVDFITFTTLKYIEEANASLNHDKPENEMSVLQKLIRKDKQIAIATVMDMIAAGIDTTGKSLSSTLYFLAKNPDKQKALRDELLQNLPNKNSPVTNTFLTNSPYLKAVIKESTRIAPVAIGNARTTVKDIVLAGYQIPKNKEIVTLLIYASNEESQFKQADQYLPERWLKSNKSDISYKNVHPFACQPFGFGPRSCIGKRLANLELEIALAKIIRNFEFSWPHKDATHSLEVLYGISDPLKYHVKNVVD